MIDSMRPGHLFTYRRDVDGLRSVAIIPVLLFHAGMGLQGGYVGVDVFFVISGYLITSVIQQELDENQFSIIRFWERRMRRLFPALAVVLAATCAAGYFVLLPRDLRELGQSTLAQLAMLANVYYWREAGYFAEASEIKPLLHTWSLAIEEQFYVLLPLMLMLRWRRTLQITILAALAGTSLAASVIYSTKAPSAAFFLLPMRAWELLLGVLLAQVYWRVTLSRVAAELLGFVGLAAIAVSCVTFDSHTVFPGIAALLPCSGAAGVILSGGRGRKTFVERGLSTKVMVGIGLLSYSLYLWHWPLFAFANYLSIEPMSRGVRMALLGTTVVLAAGSRAFVEQPIRRRQWLASRATLFGSAGTVAAAGMIAGLSLHTLNGLPGRFSAGVLATAAGARDSNPQRRLRHDLPVAKLSNDWPRLGNVKDNRPPVVAVIGDSHADSVMPVLDEVCRELGIPAVGVSRSATLPLFCGESETDFGKRQFQGALQHYLAKTPSIRHVLLIARWGDHFPMMSEENFDRTVSDLARRDIKVWILRQVPNQQFNVPRALALAHHWGYDASITPCSQSEYQQHQAPVDEIFKRTQSHARNVVVLDPTSAFFENGGLCRVIQDSHTLYTDSHHLSVCGAMQLRPIFQPLIDDVIGNSAVLPHTAGSPRVRTVPQ